MAGIGARSKIYTGSEIIAITATLGNSVTIVGEVLYPFEQSGWGAAKVTYLSGDTTYLGDTVVLKTYVSFDEGTSWIQVRNGDTISATLGSFNIPFAPRVRIDIVSDSAGSLSAGHLVDVQIEFQENDPEAARIFYGDSIGDSIKQAGDSFGTATNGATVTINSPSKLTVFMTAESIADVTDTFTWVHQASIDGTNWFTGDTITVAPEYGSGVAELASQEITTNLQKYARISVTGDTTSMLGDTGGIKYFFLAQE